MKRLITTALIAAAVAIPGLAQHFDMTQWGSDRGYHERTGAPYYRYEAEHNSGTTGQLLEQTDDQQYLQSEASNQQAITLGNGQYISWRNDSGDANGVTLRFSVPAFSSARVAIYVGNENLGEFEVNANHSWEWNATHQGNRYSKPEYYSVHGQKKDWARMRFDEEMCLLSRDIKDGETFQIRKVSGSDVTVDFVEIEKAEYLSEQDARNRYGNDIKYYGPGTYNQDLNDGKTVGAGIFYTKFTGKCNSGWVAHVRFSGTQNQRYPWMGNDEGPGTYADIKCINNGGHWENCLFEHYTCAAWTDQRCEFYDCRIRNNYADGVNFWNGSSYCVVKYCSFRNNGDDDIASWSNGGHSMGHTIIYTTCEHNWRASSLGFFGGGNHEAMNMLIKDCMENGIRCVTDFSGDGFRDDQPHKYSDISIVHCGCTYGTPGRDGDFWGVDEAALHIEASNNGDIYRQEFRNIDIYHPRGDAVLIAGRSDKSVNNIYFDGVKVHGIHAKSYTAPGHKQYYAFNFENVKGSATFNNCEVDNMDPEQVTNFKNSEELTAGNFNGFSLSMNNTVSAGPAVVIPEGVNLEIKSLSWDPWQNVKKGDVITVTLAVVNNSGVDFPEKKSVAVRLRLGEKDVVNASVRDGWSAYETKEFTYTWTAEGGLYTFQADVDPYNTISGSVNQDNKSRTKKIAVRSEGTPWTQSNNPDPSRGIQILDLSWSKDGGNTYGHSSLKAGDVVRWSAKVYTGNHAITQKTGIVFGVGHEYNYTNSDAAYNDELKEVGQYVTVDAPVVGGNGQNYTIPGGNEIKVYVGSDDSHSGISKSERIFTIPVPYDGESFDGTGGDMPDDVNGDIEIPTMPEGIRFHVIGVAWNKVSGTRANDLQKGDIVEIKTRLHNPTGIDLPANVPVTVSLKMDGNTIDSKTLRDGWSTGDDKIIDFENWTATVGHHVMTVALNSNIPSAEGKSERTKEFNVYGDSWDGTQEPDGSQIKVLDIQWKNHTTGEKEFGHGSLKVGDRVQWAALLSNGTSADITGTKLGVQFRYNNAGVNNGLSNDNNGVTWCDSETELKANSQKWFYSNGGNNDGDNHKGDAAATMTLGSNFKYLSVWANDDTQTNNATVGTVPRDFNFTLPYVAADVTGREDEPDDLYTSIGTGVTDVYGVQTEENLWFGIDGRRYTQKPTQAGVYIHAGKKYLLK